MFGNKLMGAGVLRLPAAVRLPKRLNRFLPLVAHGVELSAQRFGAIENARTGTVQ